MVPMRMDTPRSKSAHPIDSTDQQPPARRYSAFETARVPHEKREKGGVTDGFDLTGERY